MSKDLELCETTPSIGKRKEIDPDQEEAIGGQSQKKATRVFENRGDDDKEEDEKGCCDICTSTTHTNCCCPWNVRIPLKYVPEVGADWVVVCKNCGIERFYTGSNKDCACSCGYHGKYVVVKMCCACMEVGHLDNDDTACKYYGMTGENDPFRKLFKRMLEDLGLDPETQEEIR